MLDILGQLLALHVSPADAVAPDIVLAVVRLRLNPAPSSELYASGSTLMAKGSVLISRG